MYFCGEFSRKMTWSACILIGILQSSFAFPSTTLPSDEISNSLDDLSSLLPKKELLELKEKHLRTDPGYQAAVKYFKSPEWIQIIEDVRKTPEWIEYKQFIANAGFDFDYLIKHIEHCLNATNTSEITVGDDVKPSLRSFLDDVKTFHGLNILKGIQQYLEKIEKSEQYQKFLSSITSPKSKELLEASLKQPAMKKMLDKLQEIDVKIDTVLQMIYGLAGWEPTTTSESP